MIRIAAIAFLIGLLASGFMSCGTSEQLESDQKKLGKKYLRQLRSLNEEKRSAAAYNLYEMEHPKALEACIKTINDAPDDLHAYHTSSTSCLANYGKTALLPVVELVLFRDEMTRIRALVVIKEITLEMYKDSNAEDQWRKWWDEIGLDAQASLEDRKASVEKFKEWLATQE